MFGLIIYFKKDEVIFLYLLEKLVIFQYCESDSTGHFLCQILHNTIKRSTKSLPQFCKKFLKQNRKLYYLLNIKFLCEFMRPKICAYIFFEKKNGQNRPFLIYICSKCAKRMKMLKSSMYNFALSQFNNLCIVRILKKAQILSNINFQ